MIEPALAERPLWVREGAALYFAGRRQAQRRRLQWAAEPHGCASRVRTTSSSRARYLGALTMAYAQAQSCFVRQLGQGRDWRDVK